MSMRTKYKPRNPEKYTGNIDNIVARSRWEITVMRKLDLHPDVKQWGSEAFHIPYTSPVGDKMHKYFPDFVAVYVDADGVERRVVIEVKPAHEAEKKEAKSERSKAALLVNNAKWEAARAWCAERKMEFVVLTENDIYHQGSE